MRKLFLILFCAISCSSCIDFAIGHLVVTSISDCKCPQKYRVELNGGIKLYTDTQYKICNTLR